MTDLFGMSEMLKAQRESAALARRDRYICAALTGLLTRDDLAPNQCAWTAVRIADQAITEADAVKP